MAESSKRKSPVKPQVPRMEFDPETGDSVIVTTPQEAAKQRKRRWQRQRNTV